MSMLPHEGSWLLGEYQRRAAARSSIAHYLPVLFGTVAAYPGARVCEIGVDIGESTIALLAAAEATQGHVWSVDINERCGFRGTYREDGGLWTFINGASTSPRVMEKVPRKIDVLLIDSGHQYQLTCEEIEHYLPRVVPGGIAFFHDTDKPHTQDRVKEALDDMLPGFGLTWHQLPGECGMGVVRVPGG